MEESCVVRCMERLIQQIAHGEKHKFSRWRGRGRDKHSKIKGDQLVENEVITTQKVLFDSL